MAADVVVDENHEQKLRRGTARRLGLKVDGTERNAAARVYTDGSLKGYARLEWDALDAWFEEDEEIFVPPQSVRRCTSAWSCSFPTAGLAAIAGLVALTSS